MSKDKHSVNSPKGRLVEIDGVSFQVINGKLHRYADLTLDKGFKIVLGRIGSEEVLKNLLNRILGTCIKKNWKMLVKKRLLWGWQKVEKKEECLDARKLMPMLQENSWTCRWISKALLR